MNQTKMSQKQMKLAIAAQENPEHRFTNLYSLMHWDHWIECATQAVLARPGSSTAGIDGTTRDRFKANYQEEIKKLVESLKENTYEPQPVRRLYIPKSPGKMRHWEYQFSEIALYKKPYEQSWTQSTKRISVHALTAFAKDGARWMQLQSLCP